jgi:hypothetical protein
MLLPARVRSQPRHSGRQAILRGGDRFDQMPPGGELARGLWGNGAHRPWDERSAATPIARYFVYAAASLVGCFPKRHLRRALASWFGAIRRPA